MVGITDKLNFIDLFSGAGGLSCGLEKAGLNCVLGVDSDPDSMQTFKHNHKNAETFCGDIFSLKGKTLKNLLKNQNINLVVGGPPCQGFSTVGLGNPLDERNNLFNQFVRIVKEINPEYVLMENVTGLLATKNEYVLEAIINKFAQLGFILDVKVVSAHEYGVPEKRRRTIVLGTRINSIVTFPRPTTLENPSTVGQALKNLKTKDGDIFNHDIDKAQIKNQTDLKRIKRIPEGKGIRYENDEKKYLTPSLYLGIDWANIRENRLRQTKYCRLNRKSPSPTIMTHRHTYFHPTENRYLTQREAAAIQSFPNDFKFIGAVTSQWKQIGNAVPPLLAQEMGKAIIKMKLDALSQKNKIKTINKKIKISNKIQKIRKSAFLY